MSNANCTVPGIMICDQIIIETSNDDICHNDLKNQWELQELITKDGALEVATHSASKITSDKLDEHCICQLRKPR